MSMLEDLELMTIKLSSLVAKKNKTKIKIRISKKGYKTLEKTYKVK